MYRMPQRRRPVTLAVALVACLSLSLLSSSHAASVHLRLRKSGCPGSSYECTNKPEPQIIPLNGNLVSPVHYAKTVIVPAQEISRSTNLVVTSPLTESSESSDHDTIEFSEESSPAPSAQKPPAAAPTSSYESSTTSQELRKNHAQLLEKEAADQLKKTQDTVSLLKEMAKAAEVFAATAAVDITEALKFRTDQGQFQTNQLNILDKDNKGQLKELDNLGANYVALKKVFLEKNPAALRLLLTDKEQAQEGQTKPPSVEQLEEQVHQLQKALVYQKRQQTLQAKVDGDFSEEQIFNREHPTLQDPLQKGRIEFSHNIKRPIVDADLIPPRVTPIPLLLDSADNGY